MGIIITNIQRFSLHDGPGIRTTVFVKGCSLRCPWCCNPENISFYPEIYDKDGMIGTYGKSYDIDELVSECLKDIKFYEGEIKNSKFWPITNADQIEKLPGGVTFSGGEALLQAKVLEPAFIALHEAGVHITVETSLFVSRESLEIALKYIDFFYVDIKLLDSDKCNEIECGNIDLYLWNFDRLMRWTDEEGRRKPVVIRIPVIGLYTDRERNRQAVYKLIQKYRESILKIELIKEHSLGKSKYSSLNMKMDYHGVDDSLMELYKEELVDLKIPIEICKI